MPGLIDAHGHILSNPTTQNFAAHLRTSIPQATVWGVYNLRLWLDHGFTSSRVRNLARASASVDFTVPSDTFMTIAVSAMVSPTK